MDPEVDSRLSVLPVFSVVVEVPVVVQRQVPQFRSCSSFSVVDTPVFLLPVVQTVQFFLSSTSLPWRRGWFPWSCMSKTIEIPPVAVHVVVDVHVVLWLQVPQVRMGFLGPCTQVHGQGFPRHQGGEGVAGTPGACSQVFCHPN